MFERAEPLPQPDPHYQAPGVAGLLFVMTGLASSLLMLFASVLALIDSRDLTVLLFGLVLRGLPPLGHLFVGAILLLLANVGRTGDLPQGTRITLVLAAFWGLLVAGFDFCTCNVIVLPFDLFCVAASIAGSLLIASRVPEE